MKGEKYGINPSVPPMTPLGLTMNDRELAGVLTYIRNSFGNQAPAVKPETVAKVREAVKDKVPFYHAEELLKEHPFEKQGE